MTGSDLDKFAIQNNWSRFPMWDWVGGRTSVLAEARLLPAALQGMDLTDLSLGPAIRQSNTNSER
jgi:glucose-6-phosphate isomerase